MWRTQGWCIRWTLEILRFYIFNAHSSLSLSLPSFLPFCLLRFFNSGETRDSIANCL